MATHDVPGARAANHDELAMGCWAEHEDGTLIFVENTENDRVVYQIFELSQDPPLEYRDMMPIKGFKEKFSWDPSKPKNDKLKWHDKSPFPWERVIKEGARPGARYPSAEHILTMAERIAESRGLSGESLKPEKYEHKTDRVFEVVGAAGEAIIDVIQNAVKKLKP